MNCKQCGGVMTIDQKNRVFSCPFCGTVEPFDNVSKKELDKAVNEIKKENKKMVDAIVADNRKTLMAAKAEKGAKDTILIVLLTIFLIFVVIMTAYCFDSGYIFAGTISSLQIIFVFVSIFLKAMYRRNGSDKLSIASSVLAGLAAFFIIVWLVAVGNSSSSAPSRNEEKQWPTLGMGSDLPEPKKSARDLYNSDRYLSARIPDIDKDFFDDYVRQCQAAGYNIDQVYKERTYVAYNDKDDELVLNLFYGTELSITMNKHLEYSEFYWPKSGGVQYLPEPEADKISVDSLSDTSARLYIADVDKSYMVKYIDELKNAGFSGSYDDKEQSYRGKKKNVSLTIELKRGRIMYFDVYILNS